MTYAIISVLALILNIIINHEALSKVKFRISEIKKEKTSNVLFGYFLVATNCYFITDVAWGFLYGNHEVSSIYPFLYVDTVLYFFFLFLTMLTWIRYVVAYLDKRGRKSRLFLYASWTIFVIDVVLLIVNFFNPLFFSFNENHEYVTEPGRHIAFAMQIVLYLVTTVYMLLISRKSHGGEKTRYITVGLTCLAMELFQVLQILDSSIPYYATGLLIGICIIHSFVEAGEKKEKNVYNNIATSLAEDYEAMYYINIETGRYREFSTSEEYASLNVPVEGKDFYEETQANIDTYVHPDDRDFARTLYKKETVLKNLENRKSYSYKYRIMVDGSARYFRFTIIRANDDKHFILYEKDIDEEITAENIRLEDLKKHVTFSQIAEILAVNYDVIYYVDAKDSSYISYECRNIYGDLTAHTSGDDFFADSQMDISVIVHKNDRDRVLEFASKANITRALKNQKSISIDYKVTAGRKVHYTRMTARKAANGTHYIIGIENIDDEIKREKQYLKALNTEKELARRDELTGVKNKNAYHELESSVQTNIDNGMDYLPFALVVCDANNLKKINDTEGHVAGDEYIKKAAALLCDIFNHSPVFRVGGDEFVVFLRGNDYVDREVLMEQLRSRVKSNMQTGSGPVLASGMAEFVPESDTLVSEIFDRADREMYDNKQALKQEKETITSV